MIPRWGHAMVASQGSNSLIILGGYSGSKANDKAIEFLQIDTESLQREGSSSSLFGAVPGRMCIRCDDLARQTSALYDFLNGKGVSLKSLSQSKPVDGRTTMNHWTAGRRGREIGFQGEITQGASGVVCQVYHPSQHVLTTRKMINTRTKHVGQFLQAQTLTQIGFCEENHTTFGQFERTKNAF